MCAVSNSPGIRRRPSPTLGSTSFRFEEAQTVFLDEEAILIADPAHSEDEARFLLLGYSHRARCLIVSHCYRQSESVIRLISARHATSKEEKDYWSKR